MQFDVFILDPRPLAEILSSLDEMFGGRFEQDPEYKFEGRLRYTDYVFGFEVSCQPGESWSEGRVFCLTGCDAKYCLQGSGAEDVEGRTISAVDVTERTIALLRNCGFARLMTFEEFCTESGRRRPDRCSQPAG